MDEGRAEEDVVRARMIEHDEHVGAMQDFPPSQGADTLSMNKAIGAISPEAA